MAYRYDWFEEGFVLTFDGLLSIQEIKDANHLWKKVPRIQNMRYQIWDFSNADMNEIYESDAQDPKAYRYYPEMKVALVSKDEYARKLFNVYAQRAFQCGSNWELAILDTKEKAMRWIKNQDTSTGITQNSFPVPNILKHVDLAFQN